MRALAVVLAASFAFAPLQCGSAPDPDRRREDSPAEALLGLAERFGEEGDDDARRTTLRHLIERYPDSREAERARMWLEQDEASTGAP
ncbi:tetratricopeptide repeat protein [Sandaracinus amylolyticus]|uniref:tetratricopeptide repeat protein n=1 Tax=Sandaracinus amylolyticus TaxID=927083 RepID=UPI001F1DBD00|nr:hypothetical protein [Sandaracinus amylolyticus]UJR81594.1 Hypothetical protein I5071_36540 [Sandaracinus amylolyticus]